MSIEQHIEGIIEARDRKEKIVRKHLWKDDGLLLKLKEEKERHRDLEERFQCAISKIEEEKLYLTKRDQKKLINNLWPVFQSKWQERSGYPHRWKTFFSDNYPKELHREYQKDLKLWKSLKESENKHVRRLEDGLCQIDIQNISPDKISYRWRLGNMETARVVVELLFSDLPLALLRTPGFLEFGGSYVHQAWLKRNAKDASEDQKVDFWHMNQLNKNKDMEPIVLALEAYQEFSCQKKSKNAKRNKKIPA